MAVQERELVEIRGSRLILNLHPGQAQVWESTARFTAMLAGTQSGKTAFGPHWLQREIERCGPGDYLAVTATYDLFNLKMLPALLTHFVDRLGWGRYWAGSGIIELKDPATGRFGATVASETHKMWARIILRSASSPGGLESASALAAWLDEAGQDSFTILAWDAVLRRLSLSQGRVLITTTPYNLGWLKQQVYERWAAHHPDYKVVQFESILNPQFPMKEFLERRDTMPTWKFNMFYRGLFERPAGMIYSDFVDAYQDKGGHKVSPFKIPDDWQRAVGVDPGIIHTAKWWAALDPRANNWYVYREQLGDRLPAEEHARLALELAAANNERVQWWAVGAKSEKYWREDFEKAGARPALEPVEDSVEFGIDRMTRLLRLFRVYFFDDLRITLDQIGTYARELDKNDEVTDRIKDKEKYHLLDAGRYWVQHVDIDEEDVPGEISYAPAFTPTTTSPY